MSSSIEQYRGGAVGGRGISRQVGRSLSRIDGNASVDVARVEARADIQTAKVDAATAVTQRALQGAAYITNVEMQLAEACPAAMSRLKLIGDTGVMGLQQVTFDSVTKLGRI